MGTRIVGVFGSDRAAEAARANLIAAGIPEERIALSIHLTADDIAAEAPGQSYELQGRRDSTAAGSAEAKFGAAVRSGAATLTVETQVGVDRNRLEELLLSYGARQVLAPPGA